MTMATILVKNLIAGAAYVENDPTCISNRALLLGIEAYAAEETFDTHFI